jgi:hypothetical protein
VFKRIRIAVLLCILVFVAAGQYLSEGRSKSWAEPLWVAIYLIDGGSSDATAAYIDALRPDDFSDVERFFASQARDYGVSVDFPFRVRLGGKLDDPLPPIPEHAGLVATVIWSLRMRWFVTRLHLASDAPAPDITFFAIYHDGESGTTLDRSTALHKGMIAVANLFADGSARGSNQMVVAHEILHTLGATDKYDPATTLPVYPEGFADPGRIPLYPQSRAELMAGRTPLSHDKAVVPRSLAHVVIGTATAYEIGWIDALPAD